MPSRDLTLKRSIHYSVMLAIGRRDKNFSKMFITMREPDISEERSFCNTLTKDILNLGERIRARYIRGFKPLLHIKSFS